jgi:oligoribonuclease (3'-5' exoribonuclease)
MTWEPTDALMWLDIETTKLDPSGRILELSSIEKLARLWHPTLPRWVDRAQHRVLPDCEDAINELRYYLASGVVRKAPLA